MIRFALNCAKDHGFEAWFKNGETFEQQAAEGQVACPACGDRVVRKAVMAPAIVRSGGRDMAPAAVEVGTLPQAQDAAVQAAMALAFLRKVRAHVEQNFDDVGERFPEEVRRMHYGEAEARNVYGRATAEEARELIDEGIPVRPLPELPKLDG